MTAVNTLTGLNGDIMIGSTVVARTTQWAVNPTLATSAEWGDSDSGGFTNRAPGRIDATFTCEGKYDSGSEVWDLFKPNKDYVSASLRLDGTNNLRWYFPRAICTDFNMTVDIDSEDVIGWTASFGADGVFYYPGDAVDGTGDPGDPTVSP